MKKFLWCIIFGNIIFFTVLWGFQLEIFYIEGTSMFPAFNHNDICISYSKVWSKPFKINKLDAVIINRHNQYLLKRVVAIPNDEIRIHRGMVLVNGQMFAVKSSLSQFTAGAVDIELGPEEYYVLGDNRATSADSRTFGIVYRREIVGKIWIKWRALTDN